MLKEQGKFVKVTFYFYIWFNLLNARLLVSIYIWYDSTSASSVRVLYVPVRDKD